MSITRLVFPKAPATEAPCARTPAGTALLLVAHGVGGGPGIAASHAVELRRLGLYDEVAVACLKGMPSIEAALRQIRSPQVLVLPLLMSNGYSYGSILQVQLLQHSARHEIALRQPLGLHPRLADAAEAMAAQTCLEHGWRQDTTTVIIAGHGTSQSAQSRDSAISLAGQLRQRRRFGDVSAAFLSDTPRLEFALSDLGDRKAVVVGLFADRGTHGETDLDRLIDGSDANIAYAGPIGCSPRILELIFEIASRAPGCSTVNRMEGEPVRSPE
ncbi:MAG: CbiX/SirB N-terminal domain-containing protein [Dongiaceae bacterium]